MTIVVRQAEEPARPAARPGPAGGLDFEGNYGGHKEGGLNIGRHEGFEDVQI